MGMKKSSWQIKGMTRDTAISKFNSEFAYENMNIRISATDDNTSFVITNEKGTLEMQITDNVDRGTYIGNIVLGKYLVILSTITDNNIKKDYITRYTIENNNITDIKYIIGNFNFKIGSKIDSLIFYENENIQKIYWTDEVNQPRLLNISDWYFENYVDKEHKLINTDSSINFVKDVNIDNLKININRTISASGNFPSGTIQYVFTYIMNYGQESNIIYQSPLFYISKQDRGGKEDEKNNVAFNFDISGLDTSYDKLRIYSILRTSENGTPTCKRITDILIKSDAISKSQSLEFIEGENLNTTELHKASYSNFSFEYYDDNTGITHKFDNLSSLPSDLDEYKVQKENENEDYDVYSLPLTGSTDAYISMKLNNINISTNPLVDDFDERKILINTNAALEGSALYLKFSKENNNNYIEWRLSKSTDRTSDESFDYNNDKDILMKARVEYYKLKDNNITTFVDTGTIGDNIDSTELLYVGGESVIARTLQQKDNVLFLGNYKVETPIIYNKYKKGDFDSFYENIKSNRNSLISFSYSDELKSYFKDKYHIDNTLTTLQVSDLYPYKNTLDKNSNEIKHFKYLETYRFGIQFQYKNGKWTDPIWVGDAKNNLRPIIDSSNNNKDLNEGETIKFAYAVLNLRKILKSNYLQMFKDKGFIAIRPVIVYPELKDRNCICQGILCPTVYNVEDRVNNTAFVQSSWFIRPMLPYSLYNIDHMNVNSSIFVDDNNNKYSYKAINQINNSPMADVDMSRFGVWTEFRHNYPIPNSSLTNAEIQCQFCFPTDKSATNVITSLDTNPDNFANDYKELFFIDNSIITMHSPDLEFDDSLQHFDTSNIKLRIVGAVPLTAFYGHLDLQTSTNQLQFKSETGDEEQKRVGGLSYGKYDENQYVFNDKYESMFGGRKKMAGIYWIDDAYGYEDNVRNYEDSTKDSAEFGFVVYPWHRNGSLNNQRTANSNGYRSAMLKKKKLSNINYSYNTYYLDSPWEAYIEGDTNHTGIAGVSIFNSNEITNTRLYTPENSDLSNLNYKGNIDKVVIPNFSSSAGDNGDQKKDRGYPIILGSNAIRSSSKDYHTLFNTTYAFISNVLSNASGGYLKLDYDKRNSHGVDPIRMKYKSTIHAIIPFNYTKDNRQVILPTIHTEDLFDEIDAETIANYMGRHLNNTQKYFWESTKHCNGVYQDIIDNLNGVISNKRNIKQGGFTGRLYIVQNKITVDKDVNNDIFSSFLWLGELYNDNVINKFGGTTDEALENNVWTVAGKSIVLSDLNDDTLDYPLVWTEGDTFYQRYDNIKTYPFTTEDQNQITDIVSFMCETRVNLDGRTDRNRGNKDNTNITTENFNQMNKVYNNKNNYFTYRLLNTYELQLNTFNNSITYTLGKTSGSITDAWTNILGANVLDLDGDKGNINKLINVNNSLLCFQEHGVAQILYNERAQINTTDGVPIELANSNRVEGKRYLSSTVGCQELENVITTPIGVYFVDNSLHGLYTINENGLLNITDELGFHSYMMNNNIVKLLYDTNNREVLLNDGSKVLAYNEFIKKFTSFYNYQEGLFLANVESTLIWGTKSDNYKLWLHQKGLYNNIFGNNYPYYITIIANDDPFVDKIFNNLEYEADTYDNNNIKHFDTFDYLKAENEYQIGECKLIVNKKQKENNEYQGIRQTNIRKKFRIWRINIPRANNSMDRIRNTWCKITLGKMNKDNNYKMVLHNIVIDYFE